MWAQGGDCTNTWNERSLWVTKWTNCDMLRKFEPKLVRRQEEIVA